MENQDVSKPAIFNDIQLNDLGSVVRIAIAQIKGPLPEAKRPIQRPDGTISLEWAASSDTEWRGAKVLAILDWLHQSQPSTKIIIFPEYSFPILVNQRALQERSNNYNFIIVAGADSIYDPEKSLTFNKSAVFVPHKEPIWVVKRDPSQWENMYVSSPEAVDPPRFFWINSGETYWFKIYICLDFLSHVLTDTLVSESDGPGIFIVPMCSPVSVDFRLIAATLFRRPKGTATVLCNCFEETSGGGSAVCAPNPGQEKHRPALELPDRYESVAVFDLDLKQLAPPRLSAYDTRSPLSDCMIWSISLEEGGLHVLPIENRGRDAVTRGVINPVLFDLAGKKMRMAFLEVAKYASLKGRLSSHGFEALAVLGHCDVIITHVHQYLNDMLYDITRVANIPLRNGQRVVTHAEGEPDDVFFSDLPLPFFEIEKFYKVLGAKVTKRSVRQVPSPSELGDIVALGKNWYTASVSDEVRRRCLERGWILEKTERRPGEIGAIMTVSLDNRGSRLNNRLRDFEDRVLPKMIESNAVTSIFGGTGHRTNVDYLLRINTEVKSLFSFIDAVHKWAEEAREMISTNTFVVVDVLSELSLESVLTIQALAADAANYAEKFFLPFLTPEDKLRFSSLPAAQQLTVLESFKNVEQRSKDLKSLPERRSSGWDRTRLRRSLASGLLNFFYSSAKANKSEAFTELKEVHDFFLLKVEDILSQMVNGQIDDDLFGEYKVALNIQSQRKKKDLFYTDKVKLISRGLKMGHVKAAGDLIVEVQDLAETINLRNIFAHAKTEELNELGPKSFADSIIKYIQFLEVADVD